MNLFNRKPSIWISHTQNVSRPNGNKFVLFKARANY